MNRIFIFVISILATSTSAMDDLSVSIDDLKKAKVGLSAHVLAGIKLGNVTLPRRGFMLTDENEDGSLVPDSEAVQLQADFAVVLAEKECEAPKGKKSCMVKKRQKDVPLSDIQEAVKVKRSLRLKKRKKKP